MKPHDVRIGNSVLDKDGNIKTVFAVLSNGLVFDSNQYIGTPIEWCNPIPLTEEWLHKFGAISSFTSDPQERSASKRFVFGEIEIHMYNEDLEEFMFETHFIKTVHQFQNLYFSLKQEELTIKNEH